MLDLCPARYELAALVLVARMALETDGGMSGITKAQAARIAELATEDEMRQFFELDRMMTLGMVFGDQPTVNEAVRIGRKLARAILKREKSERAGAMTSGRPDPDVREAPKK